jgi:hypothetical protein
MDSAKGAFQEGSFLSYQLVQICFTRLKKLLLREGEQSTSDRRCTRCLPPDFQEAILQHTIRRCFTASDFRPAHDRGDDIIEIMSGATCQPTDSLKSSKLVNLVF